MQRRLRRPTILALLAMALAAPTGNAAGESSERAEIVDIVGRGERSDAAQGRKCDVAPGSAEAVSIGWFAAAIGDAIDLGRCVRTLADSKMALMVPHHEPVRLDPLTTLQLKTYPETREFKQNRLKLVRGRIFTQSRAPLAAARAVQPALPGHVVETPAGEAEARGTDWLIEVAADGRTEIVVYTGIVRFHNEFGALELGNGEAATARVGSAPERQVLVDPESRIQWVSAWKPQPRRWLGADRAGQGEALRRIDAGDYDAALDLLRTTSMHDVAAALLAADILVYQGETGQAIAMLGPHVAAGNGGGHAAALLARAEMRRGGFDEAARHLAAARERNLHDTELLLAAAELAVLRGEAARAQRLFEEVLAQDPVNPEAHYGLGLIASERDDLRRARRYLQQALAEDPSLAKASAELSAVDNTAFALESARARVDALLARTPSNYEALTARGINRLEIGEADQALGDFLKASVIEPRYARAVLWSAAAFYQQNEVERAIEALERTRTLDPQDPLVELMLGQISVDALDYAAAIRAAREAQRKMPYLRSLNRLASDRKGSASVGSPIAGFGLEEWAKYYADASASPFWGGSHLFLADRYTGQLSRNSELMQGFLGDPLSFGASNRYSSLLRRPGHYARVDAQYERENHFESPGLVGTANGTTLAPAPVSYFVQGEYLPTESRQDATDGTGRNLVLGLGAVPVHELRLFGFGVANEVDGDLRVPDSLPDDDLDQQERRADLGLNFAPGPRNQLWLKAGDGTLESELSGALHAPQLAQNIADFFYFLVPTVSPDGALGRGDVRIDTEDQQFRHSIERGQMLWSWGVERAEQRQALHFLTSLSLTSPFLPASYAVRDVRKETFEVHDRQAWGGVTARLATSLRAQVELYYQDLRSERDELSKRAFHNGVYLRIPGEAREDEAKLNPRFGLAWEPRPGQQVRAVAQRWRRPASLSTLAPVDTLGIVLDDPLVAPGGSYERMRLQYDIEHSERLYLQAFIDYERIDNALAADRSSQFSVQVDELARLRLREDFHTPIEELERTPDFERGSISTAGFAANLIASTSMSLSLRYLARDSDNQVAGSAQKLRIPYLPRDYLALGAQWTLPGRVLMGANAVYRSERSENYQPEVEVDAGWSLRLKAYWETADKRHSLQAIADNLTFDRDAMVERKRDEFLRIQYSYRF